MGFPSSSRPSSTRPDVEPSPSGLPEDDWPRQATEQVVHLVDLVRDKTTGPVLNVARGTVFGLVAAAATAMFAVMITIAVLRGLEILLWGRIWAAYLLLGSVFCLVGALSWSRRNPADPQL